jgi:hypothetical protein
MRSSSKRSHRATKSVDSLPSKKPPFSPPSSPSEVRVCPISLRNIILILQQSGDVDIIGYDRVAVKPHADLPILARSTLQAALDNATYGQTGDRLVYGNTLGLELIAERDEARLKLNSLEAKVTGQMENITKLEGKVTKLEEKASEHQTRIQQLTAACDGYLAIRQRFLDTFRRDILNDPYAKGTPTIRAGIAAARDGDAVTDASLYTTGSRTDESLMSKVYGMSSGQVFSLSKYNVCSQMITDLYSI